MRNLSFTDDEVETVKDALSYAVTDLQERAAYEDRSPLGTREEAREYRTSARRYQRVLSLFLDNADELAPAGFDATDEVQNSRFGGDFTR